MSTVVSAELVPCLDDISRQAFLMLAGLDAVPVTFDSQPTVCAIACRISIHDSQGLREDLLIHADAPFAHQFTHRLFDTATLDVAEGDMIDAFKELANTLGGNLKGILQAETTLSIPKADFCSYTSQVAESSTTLKYHFANAGKCVIQLCESSGG